MRERVILAIEFASPWLESTCEIMGGFLLKYSCPIKLYITLSYGQQEISSINNFS